MLILIAKCHTRILQFPLPLDADRITLGSLPDNTIYLPFKGISREHLVLVKNRNAWIVRDLNSTNGTFLNGNRITESAFNMGDSIRAGIVEISIKRAQDEMLALGKTPVQSVMETTGTDKLALEITEAEQNIFAFPNLIFPPGFVIGAAGGMLQIYQKLSSIADSDVHVMLVGETGAGKEMFAKTLHLSGRRSSGAFVDINCAAIPAELAESELFGIGEKVATDVVSRKGKLALAHNGTLFLDELSAFPVTLQAKMLRAIEDKAVYPVGEHRPQPADFRLISATGEDPQHLLETGRLRSDLYHRLATVVITIPPLRERKEDLPFLIPALLQHIAARENKRIAGISKRIVEMLKQYSFPGNIRELINILRAMVALAHPGEILDAHLLPERFLAQLNEEEVNNVVQINLEQAFDLQQTLDETARKVVTRALSMNDGNIASTAQALGVTPFGLRKMMKRLGITK